MSGTTGLESLLTLLLRALWHALSLFLEIVKGSRQRGLCHHGPLIHDPARPKRLTARRVLSAHLGREGVTCSCGWESVCLTGGAAAITGVECTTSRPRSGKLAIGAGPRRSWSRTLGSRSVKSSAPLGSSGRKIAWRRMEFGGERGTGRAVQGEQEPQQDWIIQITNNGAIMRLDDGQIECHSTAQRAFGHFFALSAFAGSSS